MARSVRELQRLRAFFQKTCVIHDSDAKALKGTKYATWSKEVVAYLVHSEIPECDLAAYSENHLIKFVRDKQRLRWIEKNNNSSSSDSG